MPIFGAHTVNVKVFAFKKIIYLKLKTTIFIQKHNQGQTKEITFIGQNKLTVFSKKIYHQRSNYKFQQQQQI